MPSHASGTNLIACSLPEAPKGWTPICDAATDLLAFLGIVLNHPSLLDSDNMGRYIERYETHWLPMAFRCQSNGTTLLAAPLDVAWLWFCHVLRPEAYLDYCQKRFGGSVDHLHLLPSEGDYQELARQWAAAYPAEPLEVVARSDQPISSSSSSSLTSPYHRLQPIPTDQWPVAPNPPSALLPQLMAVARRQPEFIYQVLRPHFECPSVVRRALSRYHAFSILQRQHPESALTPTCDIELLRRAHRLRPREYAEQAATLPGQPPPHEDLDLRAVDDTTVSHWARAYPDHPLLLPGVAYRGAGPDVSPPAHDLTAALLPALRSVSTHALSAVALELPRDGRTRRTVMLTHGDRKEAVDLEVDPANSRIQSARCTLTFATEPRRPELSELRVRLRKWGGVVDVASWRVDLSAPQKEPSSDQTLELTAAEHGIILRLSRSVKVTLHSWSFRLDVQPFREVDPSSPTPLDVLRPVAGDGFRTPPPFPPVCRMPGGRECDPKRLTVRGALHPLRAGAPGRDVPLMWCSVLHCVDPGAASALVHLQLLDALGIPLATARTTLPNEFPEWQEGVDSEDVSVGAYDRAVVVALEGRDWALLRGRWVGYQANPLVAAPREARVLSGRRNSASSPPVVDAGQLVVELLPLAGLRATTETATATATPAGAATGAPRERLHRYRDRVWSWIDDRAPLPVALSVYVDENIVNVRHARDVRKALVYTLVGLSLPLLHVLCRAAAADRARAQQSDPVPEAPVASSKHRVTLVDAVGGAALLAPRSATTSLGTSFSEGWGESDDAEVSPC